MTYQYSGLVLTPDDLGCLVAQCLPEALVALGALALSVVVVLLLRRVVPAGAIPLLPPTLPTFFLGIYLLFVALPAVIWYALSLHDTRMTALLAVDLMPLLFMLGVVAATCCFSAPRARVQAFLRAPLTSSPADSYVAIVYIILVALGISLPLLYILVAERVPLLVSLTAYGQVEGEEVRHAIYRVPESVQYGYALAVRFFLPLAVLCAYFQACVYRGVWRLLLVVTFIVALLASLLSLERSGVLGLFVVMIVALYVRGVSFVSKRTMLILAGALLVGGVVQRAQYQLDISPSAIFEYMARFFMSRIYLDPSYMTFVAFQTYNDDTGFLGGRSIRLLSLILGEYESFSSVGFLADAWVNFGWPGVVLASVMLGFITQFVQLACFVRRNIVTMMLYVLLVVNTLWLMYGSMLSLMVVTTYLLSGAFALALLLVPMQGQPSATGTARASSVASPHGSS